MMKRRTLRGTAGLGVAVAVGLGGAAIARATGAFDDNSPPLRGSAADHARAAALKFAGGGSVNELERDSEHGASYEVEVKRTDGSTVDVGLDKSFGLVTIESDTEGTDTSGE
jgi:hypothetical protein